MDKMFFLYAGMSLLLLGFLGVLISPLCQSHQKTQWPKAMDVLFFKGALLLIAIIAPLLYLQWGARPQLAEFYAISSIETGLHPKNFMASRVQAVTQQLLHYLATHQKDTKGWYLLGRLYLDQGNFPKAVAAFKQSFEIDQGKNNEIEIQYAQALYLFNQRRLDGLSLKLVQEVLSHDSKNMTALNLLAMDAFLHHRYAFAKICWKRLCDQYEAGSSEFQTISSAIEICERKLARAPVAAF